MLFSSPSSTLVLSAALLVGLVVGLGCDPTCGGAGRPTSSERGAATEHPAPNTGQGLDCDWEAERRARIQSPPPAAEPAVDPRTAWVRIEPGTFRMGAPPEARFEHPNFERERPVHAVTLTRPFAMRATEITQGEWAELIGGNPSAFSECGEQCPVDQVSWTEALAFANALSERDGFAPCYELDRCTGELGAGCPGLRPEGDDYASCMGFSCERVLFSGLDCEGYRLPTEAEWEYAARAGTTGPRYGPVAEIAWALDNRLGEPGLRNVESHRENICRGHPHPVATRSPNAWGLYDMLGNTWEIVWDSLAPYGPDDAVDPVSGDGEHRVYRGCGWSSDEAFCRAAVRMPASTGARTRLRGFRLVRTLPQEQGALPARL